MKKYKKKIIVPLVALAFLLFGSVAYLALSHNFRFNASTVTGQTATISVSPSSGQYAIGQAFNVDIVVDGGGQNFTSFGASVVTSNLTVVSLTKGPVSLWTQEPTATSLGFYGGVTTQSNHLVAYTISVKPIASGTASITLSNGSVKTSDPYTTTEILLSTSGASFTAVGQPVITAGADKISYPTRKITQSATVTNPGSGIATWKWSKTSGPGTVTFDTPSSQSTNISADIAGTYIIGVTATDSTGQTASSSMKYTVNKMSDINGDTKIDTNDFTLLLFNWGTPKNPMADLDGNGVADNNDFTIMLYWWGK